MRLPAAEIDSNTTHRSSSSRWIARALLAAATCFAATVLPAGAANAAAQPRTVTAADTAGLSTRHAGATRYDTAVAISGLFAPGVPAVYIATGATYPDALAAGAAAGARSPVLLVDGGTVPSAVVAEVRRLQPTKVVIVGGAASLPDSVGVQLGALATGGWTRLAGADRFATAAAVSAATFSPGVADVYIATGMAFPDALTGAALGAFNGGPVLLTTGADLPQVTRDELTRLKPARIVIVGGTSVVSDAVALELATYSPVVTRVAGASRYDTNVAANAYAKGTASTLIVATAANFPDALAGAALAGHLHTAMLLVGPGALDAQQLQYISSFAAQHLIVLGGINSVSATTVTAVLVAAGLEAAPTVVDPNDFTLAYNAQGKVVRWNPCVAIGWRLNMTVANQADVRLVTQGLAEISATSGLKFRYDGATTFVPDSTNVGAEPDDLIVAEVPGSASDLLADVQSGQVGSGGYVYQSSGYRIAHGYALINADFMSTATDEDKTVLVLHELAHAVGLKHAHNPVEIMYPELNPDQTGAYTVADDAGLVKIGRAGGCVAS